MGHATGIYPDLSNWHLDSGVFRVPLHPREEDIIYNDLMSLGRVKSSSLRFESDRFLRILDLLHPFI
jgi:hypothetical protein